MAFIESLSLETWMISVLSGNPDIFLAISLIVITSLAGYFRMNGISMFFMIAIFLLMFGSFITSPLIIGMAIIGGLVIGLMLNKFLGN